jgi:hypothetical protein
MNDDMNKKKVSMIENEMKKVLKEKDDEIR